MNKPNACLAPVFAILAIFAGQTLATETRYDKRQTVHGTVAVHQGQRLATILPVRTGRLDAAEVRRAWRPGDPIRYVPKRTYPVAVPGEPVNPTTWTIDPLLESQQKDFPNGLPSRGPGFGSPSLNFLGQLFSGVVPPDTVGDVGPDAYIQMINASGGSGLAGWDKNGTPLFGPVTLSTIGNGVCATGAGDPIVLYDHLADRWLISEFSGVADALCVYISQTSDPGGSYFSYIFTTPNFPDYPKYGLHPDAYTVTTNEAGPSPIYILPRADMLAGLAAAPTRLLVPDLAGFGFQALTPADLDGPAPAAGEPAYFARHRDDEVHNPGSNNPTQDFIELYSVDIAGGTLTGPQNIAIAEIDSDLCGLISFNCFEQPSGQQLDPLREVLMWRLQYRDFGAYETLVGNLTTDVNTQDLGGIRWFELRDEGNGWFLFQEGTHSPDDGLGLNRWMGSIAMDGDGNIALGYSVVQTTQFSDIRYAGRQPGDPAGTLPDSEFTIGSGSASQGFERWGDYSAMNVDPVDDCTFWYTNEYVTSVNAWDTRIAAFAYPGCGGPAVCGNGIIQGAEQCDDANLSDDDGCSSNCAVEPGFICTGQPSICVPVADADGDGVLDASDNCIDMSNPAQIDTNSDDIGNACDPDFAGPLGVGADDCSINFLDLNALKPIFFSSQGNPLYNPDADFTGPNGDPDGFINFIDLNLMKELFFGPPGPTAAGPCVPVTPGISNGSFESGSFSGWTTTDIPAPFFDLQVEGAGINIGFFTSAPTDGNFAALHGWDGSGPGEIRIGQDLEISAAEPVIFFDYRGAWDLDSFCVGCTDREFKFHLEPPGGGAPIAVGPILTAAAGTMNPDTGNMTLGFDLTPFIGTEFHAVFVWTVPDVASGPGFFQLDRIRTAPLQSANRSIEIRQLNRIQ